MCDKLAQAACRKCSEHLQQACPVGAHLMSCWSLAHVASSRLMYNAITPHVPRAGADRMIAATNLMALACP